MPQTNLGLSVSENHYFLNINFLAFLWNLYSGRDLLIDFQLPTLARTFLSRMEATWNYTGWGKTAPLPKWFIKLQKHHISGGRNEERCSLRRNIGCYPQSSNSIGQLSLQNFQKGSSTVKSVIEFNAAKCTPWSWALMTQHHHCIETGKYINLMIGQWTP